MQNLILPEDKFRQNKYDKYREEADPIKCLNCLSVSQLHWRWSVCAVWYPNEVPNPERLKISCDPSPAATTDGWDRIVWIAQGVLRQRNTRYFPTKWSGYLHYRQLLDEKNHRPVAVALRTSLGLGGL